jgi:hypothetical protein
LGFDWVEFVAPDVIFVKKFKAQVDGGDGERGFLIPVIEAWWCPL